MTNNLYSSQCITYGVHQATFKLYVCNSLGTSEPPATVRIPEWLYNYISIIR